MKRENIIFLFIPKMSFSNYATNKLFKICCCFFSFIFLLTGCSTMQLPEYKALQFDQSQNIIEKDGLSLVIDPMTDEEECKKFFGKEISKDGVLPVYITFENKNNPSSFILSKEDFSLKIVENNNNTDRPNIVKDKSTDRPKIVEANSIGRPNIDGIQSVHDGEGTMLVGALLSNPILMIAGAKAMSNASIVRHNYLVNELQKHTISPGKSAQGFVYFHIPDNITMPVKSTITVRPFNLSNKSTNQLSINFTLEKGQKNVE